MWKKRWVRVLTITLPALVLLYTLIGFFVVPWAIVRFGPGIAGKQIHGTVKIADASVNPYTLRVQLDGLEVFDEAQEKVLGCDQVVGNAQLATIWSEGFRLDEVSLLRPFVFRRYLDFGAFEALRDLKARLEREVARKGLNGNVKYGRGGIREIEFIAQAFQLIRGGREPRLRARGLEVSFGCGGAIAVAPLIPGVRGGLRLAKPGVSVSVRGRLPTSAMLMIE